MLNCKTKSGNQQEIAATNGDARSNPTMRLLLCAGGVLAGWHALRYLGRRLSASAGLAVERRALRDSTSDRRSAARWENEGGAMLAGHYGGPLHPEQGIEYVAGQ